MNIDIERLKHDREYWDSVAPEGATHAHYIACHPGAEFYNADTGMTWRGKKGQWLPRVCGDESIYTKIPRPAKQWSGDGLPPVGVECEVLMGSYWLHCKIIGRAEGKAWVRAIKTDEHWTIRSHQSFRPLKSEKDRVVEAAMGVCREMLLNEYYAKQCAEALYDAGALKMPEGE